MRRQAQSQHQLDHQSDDDVGSTPTQILERVQPDRVTVTKPEEDRRRRTIIVEKRNGSFGFTLQSYGIHYKREQEIEMITYVDYVDYDGPAYRAGMREGDVILSINGTDMEKADHKTLVNFIKNCDSRMRMVVLFEDCVRKVELHIRYIQLQRVLQSKMNELEKLCLRERQMLEGKWKTHSLPARKKATQTNGNDVTTPTQPSYAYCRPTVSTEDVAAKAQQQQPTLMLAYQYLDPHYRTYVLQPSASSSGEYLLSFEPPRFKGDQHHFIVKTPCDSHKQSRGNQTNGSSTAKVKASKSQEHSHSYGGHLCNPCMQTNSNHDNTSLEAYDLASPCCDPHCVPSTRRRSRNHKEHRRRDSKCGEMQEPGAQQQQQRVRPHSQSGHRQSNHQPQRTTRYFNFGTGLVSQCSLHSCTSSELSAIAPTAVGESSAASYTTSLSTDTLYWDSPCDTQGRRASKSTGKVDYQQQYPSTSYTVDTGTQYTPSKPKSWDNLTTKAYGGYGFGYGYMDTTKQCTKTHHGRTHSTKSAQYYRQSNERQVQTSQPAQQHVYSAQRRYIQPTKSTESLLTVPKFSSAADSDSSISCECLEAAPSPDVTSENAQFFAAAVVSSHQNMTSPTESNSTYYSRRIPRQEHHQRSNVLTTSSEITRL
ncbi:short spindle 6 [Carabus blaptoides fortunei]